MSIKKLSVKKIKAVRGGGICTHTIGVNGGTGFRGGTCRKPGR